MISSERCGCEVRHCYWCGLPFPYRRSPRSLTRQSKEHLLAHTDADGVTTRGTWIVWAHAICNSTRQHDGDWVPFHRDESRASWPMPQRHARERASAELQHRLHLPTTEASTSAGEQS